MTHENNHSLRAHLAGFMLHLEHFTVFPVYKKKTSSSSDTKSPNPALHLNFGLKVYFFAMFTLLQGAFV